MDLGLGRLSLTHVHIPVEKKLVYSSKAIVDVWIFQDRDDGVTSSDIDLSNPPVRGSILPVQLPDRVVSSSGVQGLDLQRGDTSFLL